MVSRRTGQARAIPVLVLLGCVALAAGACAVPEGSGNATGDDGLVLAEAYEDESLHPLLGHGQEGASKIFDGLYDYDADRALRPALAAEPARASADGTTWTVPLRSGVVFHNGSPFTADDVVATYRALADPRYASTVASKYEVIDAVHAVDDHTVRFELAEAYRPLPHLLTLGIVPGESLAEPEPLENSPLGSDPIGTGPYELAEWRKGDRMVLTANERYWGAAPQVRTLTVVFAGDDNTRAQRLRAGEFDGASLPPALAESMRDLDGYRVVHHRTADYRTVTLPSQHPVTGDPTVRTALNHAVDREGMIEAILAGHGVPAHTPIPPVLEELHEPRAEFTFDRAQARRILDDAGWRVGSDGVRMREGTRAAFTLMYPADDSVRKLFAQAFASDAEAVGIDVSLEGLGWEAIDPRMATDASCSAAATRSNPTWWPTRCCTRRTAATATTIRATTPIPMWTPRWTRPERPPVTRRAPRSCAGCSARSTTTRDSCSSRSSTTATCCATAGAATGPSSNRTRTG
ncbi:ABC transporter substrate-binding protein [Saccharomonospora sp. CUA-673]|uniref:ABC transporter substrate-binding protein n=1 Tax=Saccharomonospora sp. CUA-673 TaxID=1904969 RepID=UPI00210144DC|nr:ABC transporter substrate-binding protein [Saccharomonospora sp. CUA-673]